MRKFVLISTATVSPLMSFAFGFSDIQLWAGSGSKQAGVVIDFQDGTTPRSFAWGYRWNGVANGEDLLRAVDTLDSSLVANIFGSSFGSYLDSMSYKTHSGPTWPVGYWSYWTGTPDSWSYSSIGMGERALVDGGWNGWSYLFNGQTDAAPSTPVAAVPEPSSLVALTALGILSIRVRLRR